MRSESRDTQGRDRGEVQSPPDLRSGGEVPPDQKSLGGGGEYLAILRPDLSIFSLKKLKIALYSLKIARKVSMLVFTSYDHTGMDEEIQYIDEINKDKVYKRSYLPMPRLF